MAESEEELKSHLKVKEESETVGLKLNIRKMAYSWGNHGDSERLLLGGSKITADGDCSH